MEKRLAEIYQREEELRTMLMSTDEVNLDEVEGEMNTLAEERSAIERRENMINKLNKGVESPMEIREEKVIVETEVNERAAFFKAVTGQSMTTEERAAITVAGLADDAVAVPHTVAEGIWSLIEEMHPLFADARKFNVKGNLTLLKHIAISAGDAAWYDETTEATDEANTFAVVELKGHDLVKSVPISYKLKTMAMDDFIAYLQQEIAIRMAAALGAAVVNGTGTNQPKGIKTELASGDQVKTYTTAPTDDDMRATAALVAGALQSGMAVYANNTTAWTVIAGIKDAQKRPIFISDSAEQGAVGKVFGYPVKIEESLADGDILFGNANAGYVLNINQDVAILTEDRPTKRTVTYVGYAVIDGAVIEDKAFALLKKNG